MELKYCRRCGSPLMTTGPARFSCSSSHDIFYNPLPTSGVFIVNKDNTVMLSVRGIEPHKGMLDSFGGFVDGEETFEEALERELYEELGLSSGDYEQPIYLTSAIGHYPFKQETLPVLSALYYTRLRPGVVAVPADDVASIETVDLDMLDLSRVHDTDVRTGIKLLREILKKEN